MKTINVTNARKTIYSLLKEVSDHHSPILITGKHNNAVLVSEEEWNSIQETLFLSQKSEHIKFYRCRSKRAVIGMHARRTDYI